METGPGALVLFFGLFWGFGLGLVHPYRLFDLPNMFGSAHRQFTLRRFVIGLFLVNLAPIGFLWFLYGIVVPNESGGIVVVSAAVSALSIFGLIRILHAVVASNTTYRAFYDDREFHLIAGEWIEKGSNSFAAHFIPGAVYLVAFPIAGYIIGTFG